MAERQCQRRLAAISSADSAGFSRAKLADQSGTPAWRTTLRGDSNDSKSTAFGGRIIEPTGDGTRLVGLDILRASAIALVLLSHLFLVADFKPTLLAYTAGFWGVEAFFVLSGFLITGLLYRTFSGFSFDKLKIFLVRRWMRTLPLYYVAIFVTIALEGVLLGLPITDVARYVAFVQTIPTGDLDWFSVSWSLSVEEWSYVLLPSLAIACWFIRGLDERFAFIFVNLIVVLTALRLSLGDTEFQFDDDIRRALIPRLDALAYGGLLRVLWTRYRSTLHHMRFLFLAVSLVTQIVLWLMFITYATTNSFVAAGTLTLLPICLCLCIPFTLAIGQTPELACRAFHWLASRSYALYLFHVPIYVLVAEYLPDAAGPLRIAVGLAILWLIAELAYRGIERPIMDRRPNEKETWAPRVLLTFSR